MLHEGLGGVKMACRRAARKLLGSMQVIDPEGSAELLGSGLVSAGDGTPVAEVEALKASNAGLKVATLELEEKLAGMGRELEDARNALAVV